MRVYDLREYLYDVTKRYFQAANVVWAGETQPKQPYPLVMLSLRNLTVSTQPNTESTKDEIIRYYQAEILLEVNTFTGPGINLHNDGVPDLCEFIQYLSSDEMTDEFFVNDLAITQNGAIQDVSQLLGTENEHRAMAEFTVNFCLLSSGRYGLSRPSAEKQYDTENGIWAVAGQGQEWEPTPTGGGSYEMNHSGDYDITTAEIEEE